MEVVKNKINGIVGDLDLVNSYFKFKNIVTELEFDFVYKDYKQNKTKYLNLNIINSELENFNSKIFKIELKISYFLLYQKGNIIFIDPTQHMDLNSEKEFVKIIQKLKRIYKKTIAIISYNTDFLLENCDYVFCLNRSGVFIQGNPIDVFKDSVILRKNKIKIPDVIDFENLILEKKNKNIGYRKNVNDLIKDIYRNI